uniref:NB-ARC domain-containing protein n=1 Tax=Hordeum vulgare subsp. vulgare TaxID=112509 RepID=A0A8I6Z7S4_HORVV
MAVESAITVVLSKLAAHEAEELRRIGDGIVLLRDRLQWLQAFLCDADRKRRAGIPVDGLSLVCLRPMRDITFDAEDTLNDLIFHHQAALRSHGYQSQKTPMRYFVGLFSRMENRRELSSQIKRIKAAFDQILDDQKYCRVEHISSMAHKGSTMAIAAWYVTPAVLTTSTMAIEAWWGDLENVVGFDKDMEILKQILVHKDEDSHHKMFISIVGESGAGKNTLVQLICDQVCTEMDVLIRYNMMAGSSTKDLLKDVYKMALCQSAYQCHEMEVEEGIDSISEKIHDLLSTKRYLLILGGVSSKSTLNCVRASLPDSGNGSHVMLILDSENEEVAWHANTMNRNGSNGVHMMTPLDQERSAQLFFLKVLRKAQYESWLSTHEKRRKRNNERYGRHYESSRMIGNEHEEECRDNEFQRNIHSVTGGHPMGILLLAGMLRFKDKSIQWDVMMQQLMSSRYSQQYPHQQMSNTTRRAIESIFWTSFEDLPSDLKSCFLYFAAYPQDTWQDANEIVHMWVAEGFINKTPSQHGKTLEEVGHDYLKELVLRCLLRLEERKLGGGIMVVRVHRSLMRFLRFEISETGFMDIIHNVKYNVLMRPSVRRISVQSDCTPMYTTNQKFPKLHSFICHVEEKKHEEIEAQRMWTNKKSVHNDIKFLCWSKFLHVLSLKGLTLNALPDELGDMIHLRYLCVNCPNLHILPSSIVRLLNLQTLDIRNTQVEEIHRDFWKIKTLRHVLAKTLALPTMSMPLGVEEQEEDDEVGSELQTLHGVKPASSDLGEWTLLDNKITRNLRSFEMHGFQYAKHGGPTFKAALQNMYLLGHLNLQGDEIPSCVFTDPGLQSLETMEIHGNVRWDDIIPVVHLLRKVRPNLVQLKVRDINEVPKIIMQQLGTILIRGKQDSCKLDQEKTKLHVV